MQVGQIVQYILGLGLKYGFLTTYNQTTFLRKVDIGRAWVLEYSPAICHNSRGSASGMSVSFCQCLYHVGSLALTDSNFKTSAGMRNQKWTLVA